jgi:tRNA threonylcarbamoyl adenosine modification protein YeaZ
MTSSGPLLAIDTATSVAVVATGDAAGELRRESAWTAGYRHGEELLARVVDLLAADGVALADLSGIVVGTGPGAFTGLRIGLATAKTLAHELGLPIVGVSTAEALAASARRDGVPEPITVLLPAGPQGLVVVDGGTAHLVTGGAQPTLDPAAAAIAVDLDDRVEAAAGERGRRAREGLAASLLAIGAERLARGEADDVATLVPEYVSLPRGVAASTGEVEWSLDRP